MVARWTLDAIAATLPEEAASSFVFQVDARVAFFATAVTVATGVLFGLFPAMHSTRPDLLSTLKAQTGQPSGGRGGRPLPDDAGDRPDRPVDGAAGGGGIVRLAA